MGSFLCNAGVHADRSGCCNGSAAIAFCGEYTDGIRTSV